MKQKHYNSQIPSPSALELNNPTSDLRQGVLITGVHGIENNVNEEEDFREESKETMSENYQMQGHQVIQNVPGGNTAVGVTSTSRNLRDIYFQYEFLHNNHNGEVPQLNVLANQQF